MDDKKKEQIVFVLEDDNEVMTAGLDTDSGLDEENKKMNRALIQEHEKIVGKVKRKEVLAGMDLKLVRDANEIHVNDVDNVNGHHSEAMALNEWLEQMTELTKEQAMKILEEYLDKNSGVPARVYRALHTLWEEATPNDIVKEPGFDKNGLKQ
ncbi:MAG TPA: hypothetical protein ENH85_10375 [Candidatus Scalindua sp.]|nr:hypothetical protein [Candidatus Scalindua sp.]